MKRRSFITSAALSAFVISTSGFIRLEGDKFVGDCATTSDILGPYYRPGSPVRTDLRIKGDAGNPVELSGYIKHNDCKTPYKKAKVEIWHCDSKGVYDNESSDYRYRGTTYTDEKGFYSFQTILPVAYEGPGFIRPAHFHMIVTAEGYQPLVTQLYFKGDTHIKDDAYASAPGAKRRILDVEKGSSGMLKVRYDVGMAEILPAEGASIDKLTGRYIDINDNKNTVEFFKYENRIWKKNNAFGNKFEYVGNNTFEEANNPSILYWKLEFKLLLSGAVKLTETFIDVNQTKKVFVYRKDTV
jgi:catechol 1,2-dioxygenase